MKLLSPVGNITSLKLAVYYGADEVYLGINNFNARNNIDGFTLDNLKEAVDFSHLFNVKVNLAINILFSDDEISSALSTLVQAYNMGVDAFIIQDLGFAKLIHDNYPKIILHASTQMGIHNLEGVREIEKIGFSRVVLARETPLSEIKRIKQNSNIEIEYFVQGALCVCFSGNCYLSAKMLDASGNRGKCKQLCRLPYTLKKDDKILKSGYLLSAKDFNLIDDLKILQDSGVDVLKIEGRARRPFYTAITTREYRKALDGESYDKENIFLAFNREYTKGYFDGNGKIISNYNNHIGICIGKVKSVNYGKKFNEVFITSDRELSPKSILKFFDNKKEYATLSAYDIKEVESGKYKITTTQKIKENLLVNLISDNALEEKTLSYKKKRNVKIKLKIQENENIEAQVEIDGKHIEVEGERVEKALYKPITTENVIDCFNKTEYFYPELSIQMGNVFIPIKSLNEFRREVYDRIYNEIVNEYKHSEKVIDKVIDNAVHNFSDFEIVDRKDVQFAKRNIIYSPEVYELTDIEEFIEKCRKQNKKPYLDMPNFALKEDIELLRGIIEKTKIGIIANNYYALSFDTEIIVGAGLNVYNRHTSKYFDKPILTYESDIGSKIEYPLMTLRHCPMKNHLNATCEKCPYEKGYSLITDSGKELKLTRKKLSSCTFYLW